MVSGFAIPKEHLAIILLNTSTVFQYIDLRLCCRPRQSLFSGFAIPKERLAIILLNTSTVLIHRSEIMLRPRQSLLSGFAILSQRTFEVIGFRVSAPELVDSGGCCMDIAVLHFHMQGQPAPDLVSQGKRLELCAEDHGPMRHSYRNR